MHNYLLFVMLVIYRSVQGIGYHTRMKRAWTPTGEWVWRTWCKSHTNILQCVTRVRRYLCAQTETSQLGLYAQRWEETDNSNCARASGGFADLI